MKKLIFCIIGIILLYSCEKYEANNEKIIIKDSIKLVSISEYEDTATVYDNVYFELYYTPTQIYCTGVEKHDDYLVAWDFDNNGRWDDQDYDMYINCNDSVYIFWGEYIYNKPGTYTIKVCIYDNKTYYSVTTTDTITIIEE